MKTKITEIVDKTAYTEWCPIKQYPGLVALASKKVRSFVAFFWIASCRALIEETTHWSVLLLIEFWIESVRTISGWID
jgi:hypothetical protein